MLIAHLSDLHVGISSYHDDKVRKMLEKIRNQGTDHLIISGDLTNTGSDKEFGNLRSWLIDTGLLSRDRLTIVPGNHDLFHPFFRLFHSPEQVYRNFNKLVGFFKFHINFTWKRYTRYLVHFNSFFKETFENTITDKESFHHYPFIKLLGDNVALIGIDSNAIPSLVRNPACSNGDIDKRDYHAIKHLLSSDVMNGRKKIVVMHHYLHPDEYVRSQISFRGFSRYMKIFKRHAYVKLFVDYHVDLVLHGHYHINKKYYLEDHKLLVINGGASRFGSGYFINVEDGKLDV